MKLTVISRSEPWVAGLARSRVQLPPTVEPALAMITGPRRRQGTYGSWWEVAVDFGAVAAPISIVCNLIANWIWDARPKDLSAMAPHEVSLTLILTHGDRKSEVRIQSQDAEAERAAIEAALRNVWEN
jgi:hypothetical protein